MISFVASVSVVPLVHAEVEEWGGQGQVRVSGRH